MAEGNQFSLPAAPEGKPGLPENYIFLTFDGFNGLDTKPTRPAIKDQEMAWCDNFMPLGPSNLRTLYDVGPALYTGPAGALEYFQFGNLNNTPLAVVFLQDGSVLQVNTITSGVTTIAPAGTIIDPTQQMGVAQWGSQYILFCAPQPNGYFIWDGTLLYRAGTLGPIVTIESDGLGYTSNPTMTAHGGFGTGATFSATRSSSGSLTNISVTNAGSGYGINDVVFIAFSGGGSTTTAIATATLGSGGVVQAVTVLSALVGSGYNLSTVQVALEGGGGAGATAIVNTLSGSGVQTIKVTSSGAGYSSPPTVIITDAANPVAQATVALMPFGVQGTSIETYAGRVWIANGAAPSTPPALSLIQFSAAGNPADFSGADSAGAFVSTDSFLRVGFHGLRQSNGFLYLIGDSSVNYISGVQTANGITTFSNQNVDPQIGTPWPNTIQVYSRAIVFANTFGVHAMYGGAVQKVSAPLDGVYTTVAPSGTIPSFDGLIPSSAVAIIFGIHVYMLLLPIVDPVSETQRNALLMWDGQKWFTANPSVDLIQIATQEINSVLTAYGTDGTSIYPLFQTPSTGISKIVQSKLWGNPSFMSQKHATRYFALLNSVGASEVVLNISIDTENISNSFVAQGLNSVIWTNDSGGVASWTNNASADFIWATGGIIFVNQTIDTTGQLIGTTIQSDSEDFTLLSALLGVQNYKFQL